MTGLMETVRNRLDTRCLVSGLLNKKGCKVSMKGAPETRLVVDLDRPGAPLGPDETRCDYLFVAKAEGSGWVAPLELKRGRLKVGEVVKQLQAGASVARKLVPSHADVRFRPIAAVGDTTSTQERNRLRRPDNLIRFHGKAEPIRLMSCGEALVYALSR